MIPLSRRSAADQARLLDFAELVAWEIVDEVHDARALVRGEEAGDVIDELLLGRLGAVAQDDPGDHALAEVGIGRAGYRGVVHCRVLTKRGLDLTGADLVAAAFDEVGCPPSDYAHIAVGLDCGEIAGTKPAVARHRLGRRVWTI